MSWYLWIIVGTILGPLVLSFDQKVHFYTYWKSVLVGIVVVGIFFLLWDEYFTELEVWGFNPKYVTGIYWGKLPLEECLFFVVVPYACLFIHEVLKAYFPNMKTELLGKAFGFAFALSGLFFAMEHLKQWYTMTACSFSSILIIGFAFRAKVSWFGSFAFTYLVTLVPFLVVNGLLTGSATPEPIVWYNNDHFMGIRIGTIPIEDLYYNMCMLLPIVAIHELLIKKKQPRN
jgi:lycopene cyclase domain-containing protein